MKWVILKTVVLLVIILQLIHLFYMPFVGTDAGFYLSVAREIYNGKVYFIEIASSYNPLAIAIIGIPFLFQEQPDPRWFLLVNVLILVACANLLFQILRQLRPEKQYDTFISLVFFSSCLFLNGLDITLEPASVFFQLMALQHYLSFKGGGRSTYLLFCGIGLSLAFLAKQYGLFLLLPIGIDLMLNRKLSFHNFVFLAMGLFIPLVLLFLYLNVYGSSLQQYLLYLMGKGIVFDKGLGTAQNFSLLNYLLVFLLVLATHAYLILVPLLIWFDKQRNHQNFYLLSLLFSCSVLFFAGYKHYYIYILPYALLCLVAFQRTPLKLQKTFYYSSLFSFCLIALLTLRGISTKKQKSEQQINFVEKLTKVVPAGSKVYLDGLNPAYYYLGNYQSIAAAKIGYSFPGYFHPETLVYLMDQESYLIISKKNATGFQEAEPSLHVKTLNEKLQVLSLHFLD